MKFLFFDIECSNCFNNIGKMCEFGYVLTDEKFNIITKNCYVMSPGKGRDNRFKLRNRKNQIDIDLAYEEEYYYQQDEFDKYYDKIKKLLEDNDTICFAWASENDMKYLCDSCFRYHKNKYKYTCYDVQKIAYNYLNNNKSGHLKDICNKIVGKDSTINLQEHLSRDDAIMTLLILKQICFLENISSLEYLNKCQYAKLHSTNLEIKIKKNSLKKDNHKLINETVLLDKELIKLNKNKVYSLSEKVKNKENNLKKLIDFIHTNGGLISSSIVNSNYLIVLNEDDKEKINKYINKIFKGEFILIEEFLTLIK